VRSTGRTMSNNGPTTVPAPSVARELSYSMRGVFLEFCDCFSVCPCWIDRAPDEDMCTGACAWLIADGSIDEVDVSGQTVVSVSTHEGHRDSAQQKVVLFIGNGATDAQTAALAGAFSGRSGGPLGELSTLLGELLRVERAKIDLKWGTCGTQLTVGRQIVVDAVNSIGSSGQVTTLSDGRLSALLGSPAEVGVARRLKIGLPAHGIELDVRGRSAMRGHFSYVNDVSSE
jgi:hypothetical protein